MELSQLRTFRVVAETLNFTRAAERLGLTQSAVSHQIKSLETELGEPLFIRAKRGVKLSPAGQAALEHAVRLLDEAEALRERVAGGEHSPAGRVRAAAATQAIVHLFAPMFEAFMRAQPRIDVSFRTTASHGRDGGRHPERRGRRRLRVAARLLARAQDREPVRGRAAARGGPGPPARLALGGLDRGPAARTADPLRARRLGPARDRPVLQQGGRSSRRSRSSRTTPRSSS